MIYWQIFTSFFFAGLFAIGGGLATIPFMYDIAARYPWLDTHTLVDILAVAQSAPGPVGVNIATYVGYHAAGVLGSVLAPLALTLPSFIIIFIISYFFIKVRNSNVFEAVSSVVRPAVVGMIAVAAWAVLQVALVTYDNYLASGNIFRLFNWKAVALFAVLFFVVKKYKKHPVFYILLAACAGILFQL